MTLTRRLLPAPLTSLLLLAAWLMLNGSLAAGHIVLGGVLALAIPLALRRLQPAHPALRRWMPLLRLGVVVLCDVVVSALALARRILGPESALQPRFVWVPLAIRDERGIAALAGIVTMTPGTLSADLSADRRWLLVHAFDAGDGAALAAEIKARYEAPLRAILGELDPD